MVVQKFVPSQLRLKPLNKNLYIKNFPSRMTKEQVEAFLLEKFSPFGKIEQHGVYQDKRVAHFYAFVAYDNTESAKKAVEAMNGYKEPGSTEEPLYVGTAQTKMQRKKALQVNQEHRTNMYIKNIKNSVTLEQFRTEMQKVGDVVDLCLRPFKGFGPGDSFSRQYGLVNFKSPETAKKLLATQLSN